MVRAQPFSLAIVMKLNYVPPPPPKEPVEEVQAETKMSRENTVKGKGKGKK